MTPDVNVLVAASRSDHPHHTVARSWLGHLVSFDRDFKKLIGRSQFTLLEPPVR